MSKATDVHHRNSPRAVFEITIQSKPEAIFEAITRTSTILPYYYECIQEVSGGVLQEGQVMKFVNQSGQLIFSGEVIACDPPRRYAHKFCFDHLDDLPTLAEWTISDNGDNSCLVKVTHSHFAGETETYQEVIAGWPHIIRELKAYLEG